MTNYTPTRNRIIDLLRGYFLFIIAVDHAYLNPNLWNFITGQNILWVSAAEGFFFVSGLMTGMIRGRQLQTRGWSTVLDKIYSRAIILYGTSVGLTIIFTLVGWWVNDPIRLKGGIFVGNWLNMVFDALRLHYVYGWIEFLPYYTAYLLAAPLILWLLTKRLAWLVSLVSLAAWWLGRANPYWAWQIVFVNGIVVGYYWTSFNQWLTQIKSWRMAAPMILYALTTLTLTASILYTHYPELTNHYWLLSNRPLVDWLMSKEQVGPGRLALFGLWFSTLYLLLHHTAHNVDRWLGWLLIPLGQQSLGVYVAEACIICLLKISWPAQYGYWGNTVWIGLEIALVWLVMNYKYALDWLSQWRLNPQIFSRFGLR